MIIDVLDRDDFYVIYYLKIEGKDIRFMPLRKNSAANKVFLTSLIKKLKKRNIDFLGSGSSNIFYLDKRNYPIYKWHCVTYRIGKDFETAQQASNHGHKLLKFVNHTIKSKIEAYVKLTGASETSPGFDSCEVCYRWFVE
jgi:histidinol phosphatase-like PHP family hydrolase